jgi:hypothetical protein
MSINGFSENINILINNAESLKILQGSLRNKNFTLSSVEISHQKILQTYQRIMEMATENTIKFNPQNSYSSNQDQIDPTLLKIWTIEHECETLLKNLNDELLTNRPTAKINYGNVCIGPKKAPNIDSSNTKVQQMLNGCSSIREIRGDGNCFLSSFTVCYLENLVEKKTVSNFIDMICNEKCGDDTLKSEILSVLFYLNEYHSQMEIIFGDNTKILPFLNYFRMLAADEMKNNKDKFEVFFTSDIKDVFKESATNKSYNDLITEYVLKMGVDFSHPSIMALCQKLNFSITIIDPRLGSQEGFNVLDKHLSQGTFCRSGQHYYVLYKKEHAPFISPIAKGPDLSETVIHCEVPFGDTLFIRGEGGILGQWNPGKPLTMIDEKTWSFPTSDLLDVKKCKFALNGTTYEKGGNREIVNGKLESCHSPDFGPIPITAIQDTPTRVNRVNVTVECDIGWGNQLGVCCDPQWDKAPIVFSPVNNNTWAGQVPANSNWKFVRIHQGKVVAWETHANRQCDGTSSSVRYDSKAVKF